MFGSGLVVLLFKTIEKIYSIAENGNDDSDINAVTTLLCTLIENYLGKIDHLVP